MKLINIPTLRAEDYPSQQEWIGNLFIQLNPLINSLSSVLNQGIDYSSNIKSVTKVYQITTFQEFSFLWTYASLADPVDLRIVKASKGTGQTPTILLPAWSYDKSTGSITVSRITEVNAGSVAGLDGSQYNFTVRASV